MTDETTTQEPQVEESAQPQEERAPEQAAEPEVEKVEKELPDKKALRETRQAAKEAKRDAKKLKRRLARAEEELERRGRMGPVYGAPPDDPQAMQQIIEQQAAAYRQMEQERFVGETLERLKLDKGDKRLDGRTPQMFLASAAVARQEDLEDWEAELAEKEEKLEGLEDKLRAQTKAAIEEAIRDVRRESGLDKVAKPTPTGEQAVETEIDRIRAEAEEKLKPLRHKGWMKEVAKIKSERDRKIREAQQQK